MNDRKLIHTETEQAVMLMTASTLAELLDAYTAFPAALKSDIRKVIRGLAHEAYRTCASHAKDHPE